MSNRDFINENNTPQKRIKVLRALSYSEADPKSKELNIWDKRKWIALKDFWMGRTTEEHAKEKVAAIIEAERRKNDELGNSE